VLKRLKVNGFKSLRDVEIRFPRLTVLFGPNAAGKSNILDAVEALSAIGTNRTLRDALHFIRGLPYEAFSFPSGGLPSLLAQKTAQFSLEADVAVDGQAADQFRYRVEVQIQPRTGVLSDQDEYLAALSSRGEPTSARPRIEKMGDAIVVRHATTQGRGEHHDLGAHYTALSNQRYSGQRFRAVEAVRNELFGWRTYYLDPRVQMRWPQPPSAVVDIGPYGDNFAPFLFRLKSEHPKRFEAVRRTVRSLIPSVEDVSVDLDDKNGVIDVTVRQGGIDFSSRIISEGTLRVLALCAIAVNPWGEALLALEEPENGVHPRRLELIADLLFHLAVTQQRQLIVTSHSLLFCDAILKRVRQSDDPDCDVGLFKVQQRGAETKVFPFETKGPLFQDPDIRRALTSGTEDGLFEGLVLRGMIDGDS